MRTRFGRRRTFSGRGVVVVLGIGALAIIVLRMRRRAAEDASGGSRGAPKERFEEARERQARRYTGTTKPVRDNLKAEADSTQEDGTQELTGSMQQSGKEKADGVVAQNTEETDGNAGEEIRRAKGSIRLRPLEGQPLMSVIRGSVRRRRGGA